MPGTLKERCISLLIIGFPDAVLLPFTAQLFEPIISVSSKNCFSLGIVIMLSIKLLLNSTSIGSIELLELTVSNSESLYSP